VPQKRVPKSPDPPDVPATPIAWKPHLLRILAVWALALICYSNSFRAGIVYDDVWIVERDARVRAVTAENLRQIFSEQYWYKSSTTNLYRPLTTLTYLINYALLGNAQNPAGYHAVNLAIHLANIALVYCLGLLLFADPTLAIALAALWGVHPLATEAVTNIVGRADALAALGVLAGIVCHAYGQSARGRRKAAWMGGLAEAAVVAMFSKESGVVLPGIMLLYDLTFSARATWRKRWPGYAAMAIPFAIFFYLRTWLRATHPLDLIPFTDNPIVAADFLTAKLTSLKYTLEYLRLFFWPVKLSADYSYNQLPLATLTDWRAWLGAAVCLGAVAAAAAAYRRSKPLFFFVFWFFIALAPVANFFLAIGVTIAERLVYLPAIGLAGCVVLLLARLRQPRRILAATALLCCVLGARTFVRNFDWYDELSLWTSAARAVPQAARAHSVLSMQLEDRPGELDRAVREAEAALRIVDPVPDALNNVRLYAAAGECFRRKGDAAGAGGGEWYRRALDVLQRGERIDRAGQQESLAINRENGRRVRAYGYDQLYLTLARVYLRLGEPQKALQSLIAGRGLRTDHTFEELGSEVYRAMGDRNGAAVALIEGLVIDPGAVELAARLLQFYKQAEPQSCAVKGASIDMNCPMVHTQVCTASRNVAEWYAQNGQPSKAALAAAGAVKEMGCPADLFR
jgi:tetratricopeptide (TPR) repeat protein